MTLTKATLNEDPAIRNIIRRLQTQPAYLEQDWVDERDCTSVRDSGLSSERVVWFSGLQSKTSDIERPFTSLYCQGTQHGMSQLYQTLFMFRWSSVCNLQIGFTVCVFKREFVLRTQSLQKPRNKNQVFDLIFETQLLSCGCSGTTEDKKML